MGVDDNEHVTDCRDKDGVTVGLIDALISIARVLVKRDFDNPAVREALRDLSEDEDLSEILVRAKELK